LWLSLFSIKEEECDFSRKYRYSRGAITLKLKNRIVTRLNKKGSALEGGF